MAPTEDIKRHVVEELRSVLAELVACKDLLGVDFGPDDMAAVWLSNDPRIEEINANRKRSWEAWERARKVLAPWQ